MKYAIMYIMKEETTFQEMHEMSILEMRAQKEAQKNFDRGDHYFDGDVIRWTSNDRSPMNDMMTQWLSLGLVSDDVFSATNKAREEQDSVAIAQYIDAQNNMTKEQKHERAADVRAAFGPGVKVVDMFTGRITNT